MSRLEFGRNIPTEKNPALHRRGMQFFSMSLGGAEFAKSNPENVTQKPATIRFVPDHSLESKPGHSYRIETSAEYPVSFDLANQRTSEPANQRTSEPANQ